VIDLLSEPVLEVEHGRSALVLWVCQPFDDNYSFRDLFARLTSVLEKKRPLTWTLPAEERGEDYVQGSMRWGESAFDVYYERSLGYVQFTAVANSDPSELLVTVRNDLSWTGQ